MDKQAVLYARSAAGGQDALSRQLTECREWAMANGLDFFEAALSKE